MCGNPELLKTENPDALQTLCKSEWGNSFYHSWQTNINNDDDDDDDADDDDDDDKNNYSKTISIAP